MRDQSLMALLDIVSEAETAGLPLKCCLLPPRYSWGQAVMRDLEARGICRPTNMDQKLHKGRWIEVLSLDFDDSWSEDEGGPPANLAAAVRLWYGAGFRSSRVGRMAVAAAEAARTDHTKSGREA